MTPRSDLLQRACRVVSPKGKGACGLRRLFSARNRVVRLANNPLYLRQDEFAALLSGGTLCALQSLELETGTQPFQAVVLAICRTLHLTSKLPLHIAPAAAVRARGARPRCGVALECSPRSGPALACSSCPTVVEAMADQASLFGTSTGDKKSVCLLVKNDVRCPFLSPAASLAPRAVSHAFLRLPVLFCSQRPRRRSRP